MTLVGILRMELQFVFNAEYILVARMVHLALSRAIAQYVSREHILLLQRLHFEILQAKFPLPSMAALRAISDAICYNHFLKL